ncbi:MAG: DNA translocase FtsK [Chloroflexi bacterium]|nr:DNA translocase FtsK [Chloroflexota bacterium]
MLAASMQSIGSLTRQLAGNAYALAVTAAGLIGASAYARSVTVIVAVTAILGALFYDDLRFHLGWSVIPLFAWFAAAVFILNIAPRTLATYWRYAVAATLLGLAIVGVLGALQASSDFTFNPTINESQGGSFGNAIARWPAEWAGTGGTSSQITFAFIRVVALVVLAGVIIRPRQALIGLRMAGAGLVVAGVLIVAAGSGLMTRLSAWRAARTARRLTAEELMNGAASMGTEADLIERPSFVTDGREPPLRGIDQTELMDDVIDADALVDPYTRTVIADVESPIDDDSDEHGMGLDGLDGLPVPVGGILPPFLHVPPFAWPLPNIDILKIAPVGGVPESEIEATSELIVETLAEHGIEVSIGDVRVGPRVTMYGIVPGWGKGRGSRRVASEVAGGPETVTSGHQRVRVDTILAREKDLALALASPSLRFEAPVPGASLVGIEVPNSRPSPVTLRTVIESTAYEEFVSEAPLPIPLGVGSGGEKIVMDLTRMPHLLVAGATGSGKSVCMNAIATGLLMSRTPEQVRIVMIDPKRVELTPYTGVPHLYAPPVVEPDIAVGVLKALVEEMTDRFKVLERAGVRNIVAYNDQAATKMPYLVIMVDELADLMLTSASEVERLLCRLAQLGRATGIHLVVATQRPSVDVVTGLIKANFPSRISFSVTSQIDSRTIIDGPGAEKLLGKGDMLFLPIDRPKPLRIQGAFLSDPEVSAVVDFWKGVKGPRLPTIEPLTASADTGDFGDGGHDGDSLFERASEMAGAHKTLSVSLLQRRLRIGYPRAARLMDELEEAGVVGVGEPGKPRPVL